MTVTPQRTSKYSSQAVVYALVFLAFAAFITGYSLGRGSATSPPVAAESIVELLPDQDYYPKLLDLISSANKSVYIMMYVFKTDTEAIMRITQLLIEKARQGVDVRVILENSVDDNQLAYELLSKSGVKVAYDPRGVTTHTKLVIIDGYIILVGSHNFTYSAMMRNHETSILIVNPEIAARATKYFTDVWAESSG